MHAENECMVMIFMRHSTKILKFMNPGSWVQDPCVEFYIFFCTFKAIGNKLNALLLCTCTILFLNWEIY